jgi:hypothetical protein
MTLRTAQKEALKAKPKSRLTAPEMKALWIKPKVRKYKPKIRSKNFVDKRNTNHWVNKYKPNIVKAIMDWYDDGLNDTEVAREVWITAKTIQNRAAKYPEFNAQREEHKHKLQHTAKRQLARKVRKGSNEMIKYYLDREVYKKNDEPTININIQWIVQQLQDSKEYLVDDNDIVNN